MSDGPQKPVTNEEIMAALDNLQERLETLVDLTQQTMQMVQGQARSPGVTYERLSCGCLVTRGGYPTPQWEYRCPAHVGIVNMTHPERP